MKARCFCRLLRDDAFAASARWRQRQANSVFVDSAGRMASSMTRTASAGEAKKTVMRITIATTPQPRCDADPIPAQKRIDPHVTNTPAHRILLINAIMAAVVPKMRYGPSLRAGAT